MTLVYITCKGKMEAEGISMRLLRKRLIACANTFPIKSMYRWKGRIVNTKEYAILAKTNSRNFKRAVDEAKKAHSYKIPCIVRIDAKANKEYEDWADKEMG